MLTSLSRIHEKCVQLYRDQVRLGNLTAMKSASKPGGVIAPRLAMIDYAKGLGIVLVVIGHVIRGIGSAGLLVPTTAWLVDSWIYTFHIPLFFFLSGLFIEKAASQELNSSLAQKVRTIVYPYFVWVLLSQLLQAAMTRNVSELSKLPYSIALAPPMQFWYLYVLFIFSAIYLVFRKLQLSKTAVSAILLMFFLTQIFHVYLGEWGVPYMCRINIIYFTVGAIMGSNTLTTMFEGRYQGQLAWFAATGLLIILVPVSIGPMDQNPLNFGWAFVGIFGALCFAKFLEVSQKCRFISDLGRRSLEIFVAHTIFSAGARTLLKKIEITNFEVHLVVGVVAGILGPLLLVALADRWHFRALFSFPEIGNKIPSS